MICANLALPVFCLLAQAGNLFAADAVLVGAGDIARCGSRLQGAHATANVLDDVIEDHPDALIFTVGDNAYRRGTEKEFQNCYEPTWGRHRDRTRPSVGNHEYKTRGAVPYYEYFGEAAGPAGKGYYSYSLGSWHVIALNSVCDKVGCGEDAEQYRWLERDLEQSKSYCTVAYFHHPLFSSGTHGGDEAMKPIYQLLYKHGVELVLAGHEHHYERFAPQDPDGRADPDKGIRQFIVGTGGREHRRIGKPKPNSEVRDRTSYGVLGLNLKAGSYDWKFLPIDGFSFTDEGSGRCH